MRLMSTPAVPGPETPAPPPPVMAARFPSIRTRVSLGSNPRRFGITLPSPPTHGAVGNVLVRARAHLLRQLGHQVSGIENAQFLDVARAIRVHRVRAHFFRSR